jgi:transcriptional regulator with XRE-family HTH domain
MTGASVDTHIDTAGLGGNIRRLRRKKGLSQAQLGEELGLTQKVVSAYERNYRIPPASIIPMVAETLGATPDELYGAQSGPEARRELSKKTLWQIVELVEPMGHADQQEILRMVTEYTRGKERPGTTPSA